MRTFMIGSLKNLLTNSSSFQSAVHPFSDPSKGMSIFWTTENMFRFAFIKFSRSSPPSPLQCPFCYFTAPSLSLLIFLVAHINFLNLLFFLLLVLLLFSHFSFPLSCYSFIFLCLFFCSLFLFFFSLCYTRLAQRTLRVWVTDLETCRFLQHGIQIPVCRELTRNNIWECVPVSGQGFTNNPIIRLMVLKSTCRYCNDYFVCTWKLNYIIARWLIS